jgi:hypothetical protein
MTDKRAGAAMTSMDSTIPARSAGAYGLLVERRAVLVLSGLAT